MNKQSLRTIIAIYLAVLLFTAVLLLDLVLVATSQKKEIMTHMKHHQILTAAVSQKMATKQPLSLPLSATSRNELKKLLQTAGTVAALLTDTAGRTIYQTEAAPLPLHRALKRLARQALLNTEKVHCFQGETWGVFWKRSRYLILAAPLQTRQGLETVALACAIDLGPFYAAQRRTQHAVLLYACINILVLTFLGTAAINRLTVRPINRLVKRAEEYRENSDFAFFYGTEKNEFRKLSNSLNQMVQRISKDKQRLQNSLTDLQQAHAEITAQQNELIRAEKLASVGRLAAGIAHEIGNPIGIVLGYLDMLSQPDLSEEEKKDYLQRCETEISRINEIIRDLLDFSRPTITETRLVSVHNIIRETFQMLTIQPVMKNIEVTLHLEAAADKVSADPDRIRQIFVNLLINAADAIAAADNASAEQTAAPKTGGRITVTSTTDYVTGDTAAPLLQIDITDNGSGISDKNLDNIFDPFYTTKEPGKGTGLGLSVCFMIIEKLGGTINAQSRRDRGTTMTITLPLAEGSQYETEA